MSYTKGPWKIKNLKTREIKGDVWAVVDGESFPSAFIPAWTDNKDTAAEAEANAKLIAAAPELLEALEMFVGCRQDGTDFEGNYHELIAAIERAEAAIAKAKS